MSCGTKLKNKCNSNSNSKDKFDHSINLIYVQLHPGMADGVPMMGMEDRGRVMETSCWIFLMRQVASFLAFCRH